MLSRQHYPRLPFILHVITPALSTASVHTPCYHASTIHGFRSYSMLSLQHYPRLPFILHVITPALSTASVHTPCYHASIIHGFRSYSMLSVPVWGHGVCSPVNWETLLVLRIIWLSCTIIDFSGIWVHTHCSQIICFLTAMPQLLHYTTREIPAIFLLSFLTPSYANLWGCLSLSIALMLSTFIYLSFPRAQIMIEMFITLNLLFMPVTVRHCHQRVWFIRII